MVKKIIGVTFVMLFVLTACSGFSPEGDVSITEVREVEYDWIPWDDPMGDVTDELEISPEVAVKIAQAIFFEIDPKMYAETKPYVNIISDKNIICVDFLPMTDAKGGCFSIAMDRKTGEILKMWAGE